MSTSNKFFLNSEKHFNDGGDLRAVFLKEKSMPISLHYLVALLNSRAGEVFHKNTAKLKRGGYYEYYGNALEQFPIANILFSTPPKTRTAELAQAKSLYEIGETNGLLVGKLAWILP